MFRSVCSDRHQENMLSKSRLPAKLSRIVMYIATGRLSVIFCLADKFAKQFVLFCKIGASGEG